MDTKRKNYVTVKSAEFVEMFGKVHCVRNWEKVCKLFVEKVPEGNKNKVIEKVEDFLKKNPLPIIVDIFCKSLEAERQMKQRMQKRGKERN